MKKASLVLFLLFALTCALAACQKASTDDDSLKVTSTTQATTPQESEKTEEYNNSMDLNIYMRTFVNFYHEPTNNISSLNRNDTISQLFAFCYSFADKLDYVTINDDTLSMYITGDGLQTAGEMLLGADFKLADHLSGMKFTNASHVSETDTYVVSTGRGDWGGDGYFVKFGSQPDIQEAATTATVTVELEKDDESVGRVQYVFEKNVKDSFLYYTISEINSVK